MSRDFRIITAYPATVGTATVTGVIGLLALRFPAITTAFQQDPAQLADGQVWRLLSPVLVQGYGLGQFLFNMLGIIFIGAAVETYFEWGRWMGLYVLAGVVAIMVTSILFPNDIDSGASAAVAGLIGALCVNSLRRHTLPGWAAYLYGAFFIVYLTLLALTGPVVAAWIGSIILPTLIVSRVFAPRRILQRVYPLVIMAGTLVLVSVGDAHGIGAVVGLIVGAAVRRADR